MMIDRPKVKCFIKSCEETVGPSMRIHLAGARHPVCPRHFFAALRVSVRDFAIAANDFSRAAEKLKAQALNEVSR